MTSGSERGRIFQHAFGEGLIKSADEICALGSVTMGESPGRISDGEITVFDSSGIAIQDLMVAEAVHVAAEEMDQVQYIDL
jgi:alanine dehydrogenase